MDAAEPATIFISYARRDERAVLPIERALQLRGVRVLRDKPSLPLGAHNVAALTQMIAHGCDAILFYVTDHFMASDFIWRHEVPTALTRHDRDPGFHIIPVLHGVTFDQLTEACTDRGLRSLAEFNAVRLARRPRSVADVRAVAARGLRSALALRRARTADSREPLRLCLRTFPFTPPTDVLHLDLDWSETFSGDGPAPDAWEGELLPALADTVAAVAEQGGGAPIETWVRAWLSAAVAMGYATPVKGSVRLHLQRDDGIWTGEGSAGDAVGLRVTTNRTAGKDAVAIVEVAISRDVTSAVSSWRVANSVNPRWRVHCAPIDASSRAALRNGAQARAWVRRIGDEVRKLWDREGVRDVHLFAACPAEFAVLLGQQLRDRRPIHVYYGDNTDHYRLACTLSPEVM